MVTALDDTAITGAESLVATVRGERPETTVTLTYLRDDEQATTDVTLGSDATTTGVVIVGAS